MLLPRGSAGRTPTVTELNGRISYKRQLSPKVYMETFLDLFNIFNQQEAVLTDDNYTYSWAGPNCERHPVGSEVRKGHLGRADVTNANYGHALLYQRPFNARFGLRLNF